MTLARSYWGIGVSWLSGLSRYHGLAKTIIRVKGLHPLASHRTAIVFLGFLLLYVNFCVQRRYRSAGPGLYTITRNCIPVPT